MDNTTILKTFDTTIYHCSNGNICDHSQVFDRITVMKQLRLIKE